MNFPDFDRLTLLRGFGRAASSPAYLYRPTHAEQIAELFRQAQRHGLSIAPRGAGRSYGDAALNSGQVVLDLQRMNQVLEWNPETGVITVEPGVTIEQLWRYTLDDGWWPPVVPGTMRPTLGGCLGMNVHGKNNYRAGPIGEHVLAFEALLPTGEAVRCTPTQNADLFHSLISGAGLLGVFTSITLQMKHVNSGNVDVEGWAAPSIQAMLDQMEPLKDEADYLVGWVDSTAGGSSLGRGQIHQAHYLPSGAEPQLARSLNPTYQELPDTLLGIVPKSIIYRFMPLGLHNLGYWGVNTGKYFAARLGHHHHYRQSLVAFNFLLDYVPRWEQAFRRGLIQYQSFIPRESAGPAFKAILGLTQQRGLPSYLTVLKRHRPDRFLLSHAVDGFSMAMDFAVPRRPAALQQLAHELDRIVLDAGGRFYFAKDSTLTPHAAARYLGPASLARFLALKARCDPHEILQTELYRRVLRPAAAGDPAGAPAAAPALHEPEVVAPGNGRAREALPAAQSGNGKGH